MPAPAAGPKFLRCPPLQSGRPEPQTKQCRGRPKLLSCATLKDFNLPRCCALLRAAFNCLAQLLARIYGVFALKCSGCGGRVRLIGFITEAATVRQILGHVGEPTTAPAIAPARSPPVEANAQQLIAPEAVEAIPEIEFYQTANLTAEAGHDRLVAGAGADADADAEPIPELEFDQTVGW